MSRWSAAGTEEIAPAVADMGDPERGGGASPRAFPRCGVASSSSSATMVVPMPCRLGDLHECRKTVGVGDADGLGEPPRVGLRCGIGLGNVDRLPRRARQVRFGCCGLGRGCIG